MQLQRRVSVSCGLPLGRREALTAKEVQEKLTNGECRLIMPFGPYDVTPGAGTRDTNQRTQGDRRWLISTKTIPSN